MILPISKQIQCKHIKPQVSEIGMYQSAGKESVPLISFGDCWWIKDQIVYKFLVAETVERYKASDDDNNKGNAHGDCY